MFLKSNTKKLVQQAKSDTSCNEFKSTESEQLPKSILRDRSLPETFTYKDPKETADKKLESEDDRKIVRFNLETQDVDIDFTFSESEQKSSSDEEMEIFIESKLSATVESIAKSRFTVSPVFDDEYRNKIAKKTGNLFDKIENANKLEENISRNTNLKLIKPNPTDFITPKLKTKPTEINKPSSIISEVEDESVTKFLAKFPNEDLIILEKSDITDSIPEEDKSVEYDKRELIDMTLAQKNGEELEQELKLKISNEMQEKLDTYKKELQKNNEEKIKEYEKILLENKERAIEKLKREIKESQDNDLESYKLNIKQQHEANIKKELKSLQDEMKIKLDEAILEEQRIFQEKLNASKLEIEKNYEKNLEIIENTFKEKEKEIESNFQMSLKQTEAEFLLKLEERIKEISMAHKAVIDRMKDDHNITLEELLRDFKSEVR